jgi:hypothetical protein
MHHVTRSRHLTQEQQQQHSSIVNACCSRRSAHARVPSAPSTCNSSSNTTCKYLGNMPLSACEDRTLSHPTVLPYLKAALQLEAVSRHPHVCPDNPFLLRDPEIYCPPCPLSHIACPHLPPLHAPIHTLPLPSYLEAVLQVEAIPCQLLVRQVGL